uniref:Alpha-protein kinase 1-like n=1 Tax=Salarias fasciatus TaxID=181472 RepID=A0A672GPC9_SALFA
NLKMISALVRPAGALCAELASLLQDAVDMKWPFVPEKWQYKHSVSAADKTNLSDLIGKHLPQLLALLKSSILAQEARSALAVVFLMDRFIYWIDESSRLLKIAKLLHKHWRDAPIAPQLVIRQARVHFNSGKLQKAEYILSSLIKNSGATGCWVYQSESDKVLVQAVSVQVRGTILQKLGLWREAAELIWASLVGYYSLPQPDKKGISTSLGILANILVSMNDEDFRAFSTNPDIDFSLLGDGSHRLLSAAQAAKMAVVYSQYTSLFVLTNAVSLRDGTCLLSYSFSVECPDSQKHSFLLQAEEAFAIGLLTKAERDVVTSQQELHTFLKAAYSLTVTRKWLGTPPNVVAQASQACQVAIEKFYQYCQPTTEEKTSLSAEIMHQVAQVKSLLRVEPFENSDKGSFIPDSYRNIEDISVKFTTEGFSEMIQRFERYHASVIETYDANCGGAEDEAHGSQLCIAALKTTAPNAEHNTETGQVKTPPEEKLPDRSSSSGHLPHNLHPNVENKDELGLSCQSISPPSSGSPWPNSGGVIANAAVRQGANVCNQIYVDTEPDDSESDSVPQPADENTMPNSPGRDSGVSSQAPPNSSKPPTSSSSASTDSGGFEVIGAEIEMKSTGELVSLSQLTLRSSSSSLGDSFGSQSSWEKISADLNFSSSGKREPISQSKAGTGQRSKSQDSDGSFSFLNTNVSEKSNSAPDHMDKNHTSGQEASSKHKHVKSSNVDPKAETETDSEHGSFEMVEDIHIKQEPSASACEKANPPQEKNPLCFSCLNHSTFTDGSPAGQFVLSQQDYRALLAGVCHECLLKRLHSDKTEFKLKTLSTACNALHLKFSKTTGLWTARETCLYIGEDMKMDGNQRRALWVQFLHQEERLSSYVGKDYKEPRGVQFHLKDVERQMTAQYYVTEFNKSLYDKEVMAQIFFIPSEALLILDGNKIVGCITAEPYMLGDFVKLTNNTYKIDPRFQATEYGLAFGHFTYQFSDQQEIVVDLQGWVTANGKGLTYLTDPQIHSTKVPASRSNFSQKGLRDFVNNQHGPQCNEICQLLELRPMDSAELNLKRFHE